MIYKINKAKENGIREKEKEKMKQILNRKSVVICF